MTNIQKMIAVSTVSLLLGCGGKGSGTEASVYAPAMESQLPSGAAPPIPDAAKSVAASGLPDLATGAKVYKSTCSICHKTGMSNAPRLGSRQDWEARLAQGNEILYAHALHGYRGKKGSMPSRGSNSRLTEDEVRAAVDYIVAHAIPSWEVEK